MISMLISTPPSRRTLWVGWADRGCESAAQYRSKFTGRTAVQNRYFRWSIILVATLSPGTGWWTIGTCTATSSQPMPHTATVLSVFCLLFCLSTPVFCLSKSPDNMRSSRVRGSALTRPGGERMHVRGVAPGGTVRQHAARLPAPLCPLQTLC